MNLARGASERHVFVAIDGDDIGRTLERLVAEDNEVCLAKYVADVERQLRGLRTEIECLGGRIILCSGDSILASLDEEHISKLCTLMPFAGTMTFSIGIGVRMSQAMFALKAAKALGRARSMAWSELARV